MYLSNHNRNTKKQSFQSKPKKNENTSNLTLFKSTVGSLISDLQDSLTVKNDTYNMGYTDAYNWFDPNM